MTISPIAKLELRNARLKKQLLDAFNSVGLALDEPRAGDLATNLAVKISQAWLRFGTNGGPNTGTVAKELAEIAQLTRRLHSSLSMHSKAISKRGGKVERKRRPLLAVEAALSEKLGGATAFHELRRELLLVLTKLHSASSQSVSVRGRKVDRYAEAVADACADLYKGATGKNPTRSVDPHTGKLGGRFYRLICSIFAIAKVQGKPSTQVNRITKRRPSSSK